MKKLLSYLLPFQLKQVHSELSGIVEVNLVNGRKTLDTSNSNYSYGSLQKILSKALQSICFDQMKAEQILVLGMGAGSIVDTIRSEFQSMAFIDLVELDQVVIDIAISDFGIKRFQDISIIHQDAEAYVKDCTKRYELIIIDLFVVDRVPPVFTQRAFIQQVDSLLAPAGKIIFNTMSDTMSRSDLQNIQDIFTACDMQVRVLRNVNRSNDVIIGCK